MSSEASSQLRQGYEDAALKIAEQGYRSSEGRDLNWAWRFRVLEAEVFLRKHMPGKAAELLRPEIPGKVPVDLWARKRIIYGQALCQLNQSKQSEQALAEAESKIPARATILQAELASTRGRCALAVNDRDQAQRFFTVAVNRAHGSDPFLESTALGNLGFIFMAEGHYSDAIDAFQRVLALTESPSIKEKALGNLGFSYSQLGDWQKAIFFSAQAENIAGEIKNQADRERWLIDLGRAHFALWQLPEADAYYLKALAIAQQLREVDQSALCFHNLAELALRRNEPDKAEAYVELGENLNSRQERLRLAMARAEIAASRQEWDLAARLFRAVELDPSADVVLRSMAERELGNVYWQAKKIVLAERTFIRSIETTEAAAARIKRDEDRLSFLDQERFYDLYVRFLVAQERFEEALTVAERSRAEARRDITRQVPLRLGLIQTNARREKQVILDYWVTDDESFLWAITSSKFQVFKLPGHLGLHRTVDAYNREIQSHQEIEDSPGAEKLYDTLIRPAENLIPKGSHVIVIPSKVLSWVSFGALIAPGPRPHYWVEDVDISIAGSLADISRSHHEAHPRSGKELLLLGAPMQVSQDFPALKHAPEEMKRVEARFAAGQETIVSGKNATPLAYKTAGPGSYRFVHLDTHGTASDLSPLDSAIILSADNDGTYKLYAREIKDIPLRADLVTISACYGAGTRWYNNEGVVGLGWAFLRAGAHQVIAGLWEVDDASSPELMDDFYSELTQGKSAAESLRDAKLKMLHSSDFHRHPYYWASLQLYTGS